MYDCSSSKETNEMIGEIVVKPKENTISLGYTFSYKYHRRGYAFEALTVLHEHLHKIAPEREFISFTECENIASIELLKKLGAIRISAMFQAWIRRHSASGQHWLQRKNLLDKVNNLLSQKLQLICKNKCFTQEVLAGKLDVSRQAVVKWESGQAYPDISNLIQISKLFNVTNVNTYAAYMNETDSTRLVTPEIQKLITENL